MSFNTPDQATMEQYRDSADREHKSYWEQNGGSPHPETYFPGFEAGWNEAVAALSSGNQTPDGEDELKQWAAQRAQERGQPEDAWEWQHGFIRGVKDCKRAGTQ